MQLAEDRKFNVYRQRVLRFLYEKQRNPSLIESPVDKNQELCEEAAALTESPEFVPVSNVAAA